VDVASGGVAWQPDESQDWSTTTVSFTPDGKRVTASAVRSDPWESALRTWDLTTGKLVHELPSSRNLRWSPAGDYLYLEWGGSPPLRLYDAEGRVKWTLGTDVYNHPPYVGFTPAGEPVMAWRTTGKSATRKALIRNEATDKVLGRFDTPGKAEEYEAAFTPDARRVLLTNHYHPEVVVADLTTGKELSRVRVAFLPVTTVGWSADGARIAWCRQPWERRKD